MLFPNFDPVAFHLGPLAVRWYGLMYLLGFVGFWLLGRRRARQGFRGISAPMVDDLIVWGGFGVILGGRIGHALFYGFDRVRDDPLSLLRIWEGGMSFHGGLLGVIVAMALYARVRRIEFFRVADFVAPLVPIGLFAGRIGNFINGELWGRVSDLPWAMVFPYAGREPRHPSMLYEALLEGVLLFAVLWLYSRRPRALGSVSGLFLIGYGLSRFLVEFVREPDRHIGFLAFDWLTMGQLLSLPMIVFGLALMWLAQRRPATVAGA
ncbi:MAG: prolipoprotein diacylglyceryl transferase [Chromatiales bacterium]|nr:prolipoprotein diacylglyceryl transferase [Chromatiales bacterium]